MHTQEEQRAWLGIACLFSIGPRRFQTLHDALKGDIDAMYHASPAQLMELFGDKVAKRINKERSALNLERIEVEMRTHAIGLLTIRDKRYPARLKTIFDAPPALFYRGHLPDALTTPLSIVGTRKPSNYGQRIIQKLIHDLEGLDLVIVSGLAHGIDALAHRHAIDAGLTTLAILPSGLDPTSIAPQTNERLARDIIASGGCLLSEYPPGTPSFPSHFPVRNRLIAGIAPATLVVQGSSKSGTMITAEAALRENRDVLAIPGPIDDPLCHGPNHLIKEGAIPITHVDDILSALNMNERTRRTLAAPAHITDSERAILECLTTDGAASEDIAKQTEQSIPMTLQQLTTLELKGLVRQIGSGYYART